MGKRSRSTCSEELRVRKVRGTTGRWGSIHNDDVTNTTTIDREWAGDVSVRDIRDQDERRGVVSAKSYDVIQLTAYRMYDIS